MRAERTHILALAALCLALTLHVQLVRRLALGHLILRGRLGVQRPEEVVLCMALRS